MFDVIVVGGGHAGIEATLSCARLGFKTALFTLDFKHVVCNCDIVGLRTDGVSFTIHFLN